ncbi:hypothetical protein [Clostridium oceanicum]|uniref:Uncharacterized protein n=1 Tax=Clostridium oceanicum TaxID=1543 RepID=A0ABP3ULM2_9CLOT
MKEISCQDIVKQKLDIIIRQIDDIKKIIGKEKMQINSESKNNTTEEFLRKFMDD